MRNCSRWSTWKDTGHYTTCAHYIEIKAIAYSVVQKYKESVSALNMGMTEDDVVLGSSTETFVVQRF